MVVVDVDVVGGGCCWTTTTQPPLPSSSLPFPSSNHRPPTSSIIVNPQTTIRPPRKTALSSAAWPLESPSLPPSVPPLHFLRAFGGLLVRLDVCSLFLPLQFAFSHLTTFHLHFEPFVAPPPRTIIRKSFYLPTIMATNIELSIEETNKLRISLGLAPLKMPANMTQQSSSASVKKAVTVTNDEEEEDATQHISNSATQQLAEKVERAKRKRALAVKFQGPTLGDESFEMPVASEKKTQAKRTKPAGADSSSVTSAIPELKGEIGVSGIMILQDSHLLDGYELAEDDAKLVALESGGRLGPKPLISTIEPDDKDDDDDKGIEKPFAPEGARLFVTSSLPTSSSDTATTKKASKPSKLKAVAIPKIERRNLKRPARKRQDDDDGQGSMGNNRMQVEQAQDREDIDEEDDLEMALAQTRRANIVQAESIAARVAATESMLEPIEGEVLVLGSFGRVEAGNESEAASAAAAGRKPTTEGADDADQEMIDAATPGASTTTSSAATTTTAGRPNMPPPAAPASSSTAPKPKPTHRGLASSLSALFESGDLIAEEEIIVGRTKDVKPNFELNRPGEAIKLEYRDDHGRLLTPKEAFRQLSHQMRGQTPSAKKLEKRQELLKKEELVRSARAGDTPLSMASATNKLLQKTGTAHLTLLGAKKNI